MEDKRPLLCIAGKNRIAADVLEHLANESNRLVALPIESDSGKDTWQPSFRKKASELDVRIVSLDSCKSADDLIFLSLEYDKLIRPNEFASQKLYNLHFSLLPAYKGCFTSIWPIVNGEEKSGVTLHVVNQGIDTGSIVEQVEIPIRSTTTARELYDLYQDFGTRLIINSVATLLSGEFESSHQKPTGSSYFSRSSLSNLDFEINTRQTAFQISCFVRGVFFPEFQTATFKGQSLKSAKVSREASIEPPGTVIFEDSNVFCLSTIDYDIVLEKFS